MRTRILDLPLVAGIALALVGAAGGTAATPSVPPARTVIAHTGLALGVSQPLRKLERAARPLATSHSLAATIGGTNVNGIASTGSDALAFIHLGIAVGKTQVVESAEDKLMICTKATGACGAAFPAISLFQTWNGPDCSAVFPPATSGATVAYDSLADRFVVVEATNNDGYCVAVSQTGDAAGAYTITFLPVTLDCCSSELTAPVLAVWPDGYYIGDEFTDFVTVIQRSWYLTPQNCCPAAQQVFMPKPDFVPTTVTGTTAPPAGASNLLFTTFGHDVDVPETQVFDGMLAIPLHVDWANPANTRLGSTTTLSFSTHPGTLCPGYPEGGCIIEAGRTSGDATNLGADGGTLQSPASYRNRGGTQSVQVVHDVDVAALHDGGSPVHGGVWWHSLSVNSSGVPALNSNDGQYAPDANSYWAGSSAMDRSGDIALSYDVSSSSVFPSVRLTGRLAGDAVGQMTQGQTTAVTSGSVSTQCCGGVQADWSKNALAVDPDGCTFWNAGLFVQSSLWASRITSFALPGCNLALGKPATSSSNENGSLGPANAVDGNTSTRWSSTFSDPQWVRVDLGTPMAVKKVVLRWEAAYARSFQIQVSNNGTSWTTIYSTTTGTGGTQTLTGLNGVGRYVRMNGTQRATGFGYSLYELEVYSG
jgi:hypothetical protein